MRIALIVNDDRLSLWSREALRRVDEHEVVLVLSCTNTRGGKRRWKHCLYYALNLLAIRNRESRATRLSAGDLPGAQWHELRSGYRGAWQVLPEEVISLLRSSRVEAVVKFGMGLLVVPDRDELPVPILSYHHGNPEKYRGRPAGFYEIRDGEDSVGVMVQRITNELDAGQVLAYAESALYPHSYKKTMIALFRTGHHLLAVALRNLESGRTIDMSPRGRNYRLPANAVVLRFVLRELASKVRRVAYGALVQKRWRVSLSTESTTEEFLAGAPVAGERILDVDRQFSFYADPFLVSEDTVVVVEALSKRTGVGALALVSPAGTAVLTGADRHHSYPSVIREADRNSLGRALVWDWYEETVNPMAGIRRLRGLIANRRSMG